MMLKDKRVMNVDASDDAHTLRSLSAPAAQDHHLVTYS
jgi:hypothetical protein